jgi:hypothetical protein
MQKIQITNPERLNEFKFQIDGAPFVVKYLGTNTTLGGDNIYWSIYQKDDISKDYRISLMKQAEPDEDGREIKHRVIINNPDNGYSRAIFVYGSTLWDMAEFCNILMKEVIRFEQKYLPF